MYEYLIKKILQNMCTAIFEDLDKGQDDKRG